MQKNLSWLWTSQALLSVTLPSSNIGTSRHAVHLFSSGLLQLCCIFIVSLLLHVSVCPPHILFSPLPPLPYDSPYSPSSSPAAASCPLPHLARRVTHECQAGIQGVCRRASLTGSVGAAAGRPCCPDSAGSRHKHAVLIG